MSTATTHIETKKQLVPALRFNGQTDNWESLNLKQLIKDLQSGISVNSEDRPIADDSEFGILKTSAVANGVFTKSENKKIVDDEITRAKLNPTENEIIISRMNTPQLVGESGYIDKTYPNLFVPDRLWQTLTYSEKCHNRWLSYFLITDRVRYNLKSIATGTSGTMKNISKPNFLGIKVNCPSLTEQQKIAAFLSAVDEKIQQLTQKQELLEQYKKGVMQQLFSGQLRFKDQNGNPYPNWEEKRMGDIMAVRNDQAPKSEEYPLMAFIKHVGVAPKGERYNREFLVNDGDGKKYKKTEYGDFIYSSNNLDTGSIGLNRYGSACISPVYSIFQIKELCDYQFISRFLVRKSFINKMLRFRQGVVYGQWKIHESAVLTIKEKIPCLEEQQKIATYLSSIDTKIESVNNQINQTQTFKKGLLQQMFV